ncbi:putative procollagen-proline 4-dioxygenase [Helianthus annuus]|uniref:Procollagen-proline 4-dioxygenase n=1 Tax=Helianthus annuus TaxID=4232 RepID=A0A9K3IAA9_HELAN|nr:putative procollagen-proline 4-dioxygenase [Helianthus annuus]KAJ0544335.1 putative procollagen-proline 4-dioxygenase [Helianthus annuus]
MAKVKLAPSNLALRKGETAENTKGIRTSLDMFISASEDKTGILDQIEKKIERATVIPRSHGEVFFHYHLNNLQVEFSLIFKEVA